MIQYIKLQAIKSMYNLHRRGPHRRNNLGNQQYNLRQSEVSIICIGGGHIRGIIWAIKSIIQAIKSLYNLRRRGPHQRKARQRRVPGCGQFCLCQNQNQVKYIQHHFKYVIVIIALFIPFKSMLYKLISIHTALTTAASYTLRC